jgi:hypothetical protein
VAHSAAIKFPNTVSHSIDHTASDTTPNCWSTHELHEPSDTDTDVLANDLTDSDAFFWTDASANTSAYDGADSRADVQTHSSPHRAVDWWANA